MTSKERITSAQGSSNLRELPPEQLGDVDILRAWGSVGIHNPIGVSLWRLKYGGQRREYQAALEGIVGVMARRNYSDIGSIARVLNHWLDDICHACHGRGYDLVPGTPALSERACQCCHGQGRTKLEKMNDQEVWLSFRIEQFERDVASAVMKKLDTDLDMF